MQFSEHFEIERTPNDDWFDSFLLSDTRLFVDPFLIFDLGDGIWSSSHDKIIQYFNAVLSLVAKSRGDRRSAHYRKAASLLLFPEPPEFCLGYGKNTIMGSGAAQGLQSAMLEAAEIAIQKGLVHLDHFDELALFGKNIGADRISDIVCNILKSDFMAYTQAVCRKHDITTDAIFVRNSGWSATYLRWRSGRVQLPHNPAFPVGVLLCPEKFLASLPVADPHSFWDWAWENYNSQLRDDFNYEISRNVDTETIIAYARRRPGMVRCYIEAQEGSPPRPYDLRTDELYRIKWGLLHFPWV